MIPRPLERTFRAAVDGPSPHNLCLSRKSARPHVDAAFLVRQRRSLVRVHPWTNYLSRSECDLAAT